MNQCFVVTVAVLLLTACAPDEQAEQHKQADKGFQQAQQQLADATSGYLNDPAFPNAGEIGASAAYRARQLDQAETQLNKLIHAGSPGQQLASSAQLAAVKAFKAQRNANQAIVAWSHLTTTANDLLATVAGINNAATLAHALKTGKAQQALDALQQRSVELKQQLDVAQSQVETLQRQSQSLQQQQSRTRAEHLAKIKQAAKLTDQLNAATGEKRRDMGVQAAKLRFEAAQLAGQIATLATQIDLAQAKVNDALARKQSIEKRYTSVKETRDSLNGRIQKRQQFLASAQTMTGDFGTDLAGALNALAKQYNQQVIQPLDNAIDLMGQAVKLLENARSLGSDYPVNLAFNLASKHAQLAYIQHQQVTALTDYQHLVKLITDQAAQAIDPAKLKTTQDTLALVAEHIDTAGKQRTEQLTHALQTFDKAVNMATTKPIQIACYQQLVSVTQMLMETTGQTDWKAKHDEYRQKLNGLKSSQEAAA